MENKAKFKKLFESNKIGEMTLANRIVMPPMATSYADEQGHVTDQLIDYYCERARGGVGLIIVEFTCVDAPFGKHRENQLCIHQDSYIPGLSRLVSAVHEHGTKIALQLHHVGRTGQPKVTGIQPVAPSPISSYGGEIPRELSIGEIELLVDAFAQGASRAVQAGFDAVELHCAHGFLISQFLSPLTNKRSDKYGGDLSGRMRFVLEILATIKKTVGQSYPVICRINGDEGLPGGHTLDATRIIAQKMSEAGADAIHVSAGMGPSTEEDTRQQRIQSVPIMVIPPGHITHLSEGIKEAVSIPVIAVGRINTPQLAEEILQKSKADLVSIGRGLIADPYWPQKAALEQTEEIRPCIACYECSRSGHVEKSMACAVNPTAGKESNCKIELASNKRRVLIVGGGPAGMEAARVAVLRGHKVTLCEKRKQLGGNLLPAAALDCKKEISNLTNYLSAQVKKLGVVINFEDQINLEEIVKRNPEVVINATGSDPDLPNIPGIEGPNVAEAVDVLTGRTEVKGNVVVVGGGLVGCEVAAFIVQKNVKVTLVTRRSEQQLAVDMIAPMRKWFFSMFWPQLKIRVISQTTFKEVTEKGLQVTDQEGNDQLIPGDTVVFALGLKRKEPLFDAIEGNKVEFHQVGDCNEPRLIRDAIREGFQVGLKI